MTIRDYFAAAAGLVLGVSCPAAAQEALVLSPSGPWNVEYAPESCVLARAFGPADAPVYFRMEQFEPGPHFEVQLVGSPIRSNKVSEDVQVSFAEELDPIMTPALFGRTDKKVPAFSFLMSLREAAGGDPGDGSDLTPAELAALEDFRVAAARGGDVVVLKTGALGPGFTALKVCMNKLLTQWGVDPAKHQELSQRVQPINADRWIRADDYPKGGLHAGESASIHFRVSVGRDGKVEDCAVQSATQGADFARRTCTLISRRAKFDPALDTEGKPVPSYYVNTIRWLMRRQDPGDKMSSQVFDDLQPAGRVY